MTHRRIFFGWWIAAAACFTLMLTVGIPFYGMPFFYDYFIKEFGWSRAVTTSGIALATILIQPIAGSLIHRFTPRRMIAAGAAILAASLIAFSAGNGHLLVYYAAWCCFMAGYVYSGPIPHQVLISQWFYKRRGLVMGLAYLGLGLGGAISQKYVALPLISALGWRSALLVMGLITLAVIPVMILIVRNSPTELRQFPDGAAQAPPEFKLESLTFRELCRRPEFWLLAVGSFCSIGAIGSINQHMKLLFQDAGLTADKVADTTFLLLFSSLAGRVVMGWLADQVSKKLVMIAAYLLVACPIPLLFIIDKPNAPELFAVIFGFGLGADYMLIPLMAAQLFGPNSLPRTMGLILPADSIAQTCFPFLLGVLHDRQGDYTSGLVITVLLALSGATAISLLPKDTSWKPASALQFDSIR